MKRFLFQSRVKDLSLSRDFITAPSLKVCISYFSLIGGTSSGLKLFTKVSAKIFLSFSERFEKKLYL
jgi:hypothetical protein